MLRIFSFIYFFFQKAKKEDKSDSGLYGNMTDFHVELYITCNDLMIILGPAHVVILTRDSGIHLYSLDKGQQYLT